MNILNKISLNNYNYLNENPGDNNYKTYFNYAIKIDKKEHFKIINDILINMGYRWGYIDEKLKYNSNNINYIIIYLEKCINDDIYYPDLRYSDILLNSEEIEIFSSTVILRKEKLNKLCEK